MGKVAAAIARRNSGQIQPLFFQRCRFKILHARNRFTDAVPVHVQQCGAQQLRHVITLIELGCIKHAFPQRVRHRFTGFVVTGIVGKHLRMAGPVLVDLRREFNEITWGIGAGERGETLAGKQAVKGVTKLVEQGDDVIPGEKRNAAVTRLLVVADVVDHRTGRQLEGLLDEIAHPGPALFGIAGKVVAVKQRHALTGVVENFPYADVRVVNRNIEPFHKADAKQLAGRPEYAILQYGVERKIGSNLRFIEGVFRLAHALGIKGPVPGLHGEAALLVINHFLNIGLLALCTGTHRGHNAAHKGQRGLWRFRHLVGDAPARVILKAQQAGLPRAQRRKAEDQRSGVVFIPFLGTRPACVKQVFARLPIAQR